MIKRFFASRQTAVSQPTTEKINSGQVLQSRQSVYASPDKSSMQVSQLLFGELYDVYQDASIKEKNWYLIQSQRDHYVGYIYIEEVESPQFKSNAKVSQLSTVLYAEPNMKSPIVYELPLGAEVFICTEKAPFEDDFALDVLLTHQDYYFIPFFNAWVVKQHLVLNEQFHLEPVALARQFIGLSYVWGGRSGWGCDCSSLVQLCYELCGCRLPRDSALQADFTPAYESTVITMGNIQAGDLLFWPGHVAMASSATTLIHATCFSMQVIEEGIDIVDQRHIEQHQTACLILRPILPRLG